MAQCTFIPRLATQTSQQARTILTEDVLGRLEKFTQIASGCALSLLRCPLL